MIEGVPAVLGLASPLGATIAVFYLVFTGRLWVRAAHEDVVRVLQNQITAVTTDRNNWQSAANLANQTNADLAKTNAALIETGRFSTHVMSALQENAAGGAHETIPAQAQ